MDITRGLTPLLDIKSIRKSFGGLVALQDVNLQISQGEIVGLIGPNGAGKSTLFNVITGNIRQDRGEIFFEGSKCSQLKPFKRCRLGIARTYQTVRPFLDHSVEENIDIGLHYGRREGTPSSSEFKKKMESILTLLGLDSKRQALTRNLTLVDRKLVEMGRALATNPKLLLLDEVLCGLNPVELEEAVKLIKNVSVSLGITVIWVEHIMRALLSICDRFVVLNYGVKLVEGRPADVLSDERVIEAYLGKAGKQLTQKSFQPLCFPPAPHA